MTWSDAGTTHSRTTIDRTTLTTASTLPGSPAYTSAYLPQQQSSTSDAAVGVPVARSLANAGHRVTGVDISEVQIERARPLLGTALQG